MVPREREPSVITQPHERAMRLPQKLFSRGMVSLLCTFWRLLGSHVQEGYRRKTPESEAAGGSCSILGEGFSEDILRASESRWLPEVVGGSKWHVSSFLLLLASEKLKHPPILYILILCKNLENSVGVGGL